MPPHSPLPPHAALPIDEALPDLRAALQARGMAVLQASDLSSHTQFTRTSLDEILAVIAEIRRKGFAINSEELFLGDMAVAAPVRCAGSAPPPRGCRGPWACCR